MNRRQYLLILAAVLVALFAGATLSDFFKAQPAQAQLVARGQRWEYAAVTGVRNVGNSHMADVCVFTNSGCEKFLTIEASDTPNISGSSRQNAIAKAVSGMGDAGWEMVGGATLPVTSIDGRGTVTTNNSSGLYFRRRKE